MKKYILSFFLLGIFISAFTQNVTIIGSVLNEDGNGICNAIIQLIDTNEDPSVIETYQTDDNGNYQFDNLTTGSSYAISVKKEVNTLNGVSTFDLVQISKHILGIKEIQNPFILYSLDVDNSLYVSVRDMVIMRRVILGIDSEFPRGSWQFFNANTVFTTSQYPWVEQDTNVLNFDNLTTSVEDANFIGYKVGDANPSAVPCEN